MAEDPEVTETTLVQDPNSGRCVFVPNPGKTARINRGGPVSYKKNGEPLYQEDLPTKKDPLNQKIDLKA